MPSSRRVRFAIIALAITALALYYFSVRPSLEKISRSAVCCRSELIVSVQNDSGTQEFYSRTVAALDKKQSSDAEVSRKLHEVKDDFQAHRPQAPIGGTTGQKPLADDSNKDKSHVEVEVPQNLPTDKAAQMKAPSDNRPPEDGTSGEKSVAGRKTMQKGDARKTQLEQDSSSVVGKEKSTETSTQKAEVQQETKESKEAHEVEQEINSILKRSPSTSPSSHL